MNSFGSRSKLRAGNQEYEIYRLDALEKHNCAPQRLPFSLKILLENLLRTENGRSVTADDVRFLAEWKPQAVPDKEIAFTPARVLMQDFTGVPAVVDLGAPESRVIGKRDSPRRRGGAEKGKTYRGFSRMNADWAANLYPRGLLPPHQRLRI